MDFTKMHGAGNDYVYVDARGLTHDWPSLAREVSDRHFGVGSDGLILMLDSEVADLKMRMFNADGSEGEMCGNGIRCFAKFAIEGGAVAASTPSLDVETLAGVRTVAPVYREGRVSAARVSMGMPGLKPAALPVILGPEAQQAEGPVINYPHHVNGVSLSLTFVSMGNPHAVAFLEEPVGEFDLHRIGPRVEHDPMFPNRVNFEVVNASGDGSLAARVWERGSGETMACGTGACAIAVAACLQGLAPGRVDISLPGGTLSVDWDGEGEVYLEGPAEQVFTGEWVA